MKRKILSVCLILCMAVGLVVPVAANNENDESVKDSHALKTIAVNSISENVQKITMEENGYAFDLVERVDEFGQTTRTYYNPALSNESLDDPMNYDPLQLKAKTCILF